MKSWSRNVKKWILFLKITGILVILCMIAGACILYAAENHIQLLKNNLSNEVWESGCEWVWQQIFPLSMDLTGKHSNQTLQTQKKWSSINTMDPAYDQYEKAREFYRTHEYLAWIGEDESDEETIRSASEAALDQSENANSPANTDSASAKISDQPMIYPMQQLMDYDFLMKHFYNVHTSTTADRELMNAKNLLSKDLTLEKEDAPQILIYHTHSQESYKNSKKDENVVAVGQKLTDLLTEKGWNVYHDTTVYDLAVGKLDRSRAYTYALEGINEILARYPSIQVVLDIHRDGVGEDVYLKTEIGGQPSARIMFFNGLSQTPEGPISYLANPFREDNLAFSLKLQLKAEEYYPGFTRKIYLKGLRYNQHLRARSALVEVGAQTNTFEEACNAMMPLAELLDMVLQGK